ncbi:hypothetical protein SAMD00019534_025280 [Acytostelium subglobosum LB1]|uniref:hypothetical protein n=1 Tax=Acytostelium subglobosum LB1 TaxID=1410327 RepID=UPI00064501BB|nr:hypothetical protein SAMD00019534_025280 [Acytostelium subglobosum LB1]GAM19353.1 hypothetical protein SAMD00019534_025280 [Acytostelium subglobosum LB1]|eukprot:XP_012757280.1 hypothetical protein SAMD00019534_025280 [Acytostelium subglobosum LB1]
MNVSSTTSTTSSTKTSVLEQDTTASTTNIDVDHDDDHNDEDEEINEHTAVGTGMSEALTNFLQNKPQEFLDFLKENAIPLDSYDVTSLPRFIRVNTRLVTNEDEWRTKLEEQLHTKLISLPWLPNFYRLQDQVGIASSKAYKNGEIYGMDASSGAAVLALDPQPGDNVLDICCAPGTKLSLISDVMKGQGTVTGVDISMQRLASCKTVLKKYKIPNARLFQCDASTFDIKAPIPNDPIPFGRDQLNKKKQRMTATAGELSSTTNKDNDNGDNNNDNNDNDDKSSTSTSTSTSVLGKRKNVSKKSTKRATYDLAGLYFCNTFHMRYSNAQLYDRVIVDAECSLDASVRHLLLHRKLGRNFIPAELTELTNLQKRLIETGFRMLKVGGTLVYSTCSFCRVQNEDVVQWLLDQHPTIARLMPCFQVDANHQAVVPFSPGHIPNTYRFYPKNGTSGMFISKFTKVDG